MKKGKQRKLRQAAMELLEDPAFFSRICRKLEEMGLVGEKRNAQTIFLAGLTKAQAKPVSVIVKGCSSSGKSNLVSKVCELFPSDSVQIRASLTQKAPAYGEGSLSGKILYLFEYRGGKDAMYLTRLQQSEGRIAHEFTTVSGRTRSTQVVHREGSPVVLTSTTEKRVFADDETRFLSLRADDSSELTREIVRHRFVHQTVPQTQPSAEVWREATRILTETCPKFTYPRWLEFIAERIPADDTRARRDANRFCTLLEAVAMVQSFSDGRRNEDREHIEINFADYCIAYEILNEAFSSTYSGVHPQVLRVAERVRELHKEVKRSVTTHELAEELNWENQVTYKWLKAAVTEDLVRLEPGTNEKNVKRYSPGRSQARRFLPDPVDVLNHFDELDESSGFLDPLTGKLKKLRRQSKASSRATGSAA
jgi:hypothetical protein